MLIWTQCGNFSEKMREVFRKYAETRFHLGTLQQNIGATFFTGNMCLGIFKTFHEFFSIMIPQCLHSVYWALSPTFAKNLHVFADFLGSTTHHLKSNSLL